VQYPPQAPYPHAPHPAYQPPHVYGSRLTLSKQAQWPPLCVKCGAQNGLVPRTQNFQWVPPWTYWLLFAGLLPAALVQMITMKRATVVLPICASCNSRWTMARVVYVLAVILPIFGGLVIAGVGAANGYGGVVAGGILFMVAGMPVLAVMTSLLLVRPRTLRVAQMDDWTMSLDGIAPHVLAVFAGPPR
jgi:hypothetical protein